MSANLYALLVGIDAYPLPVAPLAGCGNDVRALRQWLEHRVPDPARLAVAQLLDAQATRAALIQTFRAHLGQAGAGDTALFFYSGHGSQESAPPEYRDQEPDGLDETLVAYDSRLPGGWDLADKELAVLIAEVAARGAHVLVILDSCHSGTATRLPTAIAVRRMHPRAHERPADSFWFADQQHAPPRLREAHQGWRVLPHGPHVLLAACHDYELAAEYIAPDGTRRGVFSYALLEALQRLGSAASYRDLHKQVQTLVGNRNPAQLPSAEGDLDRVLLEGGLAARPQRFYLQRIAELGWRLDAGAVQGIQPGTRLAVLPPAAPASADALTTLATVRVVDVEAASSAVELVAGALPADTDALPALITHLPLAPLRVALSGDAGVVSALAAAISQSAFLALAHDAAAADLLVLCAPGECRLRRPTASGDLLAPLAAGAAALAELVRALEHIARWQLAVQLNNPDSPLAEQVQMQIFKHRGAPPQPGSAPETAPFEAGEQIRMPYRLVQGQLRPERFTVLISNTGPQPLFFALLALSESFAIRKLRDEAQGRLLPGASVWLQPVRGLEAEVPDELYAQGITQRRDVLLLLVSEQAADFSLLEQPALGLPYVPHADTRGAAPAGALEALLRRVGTREIGEDAPLVAHQWAAQTQAIIAERPAAQQQLDGLARSYDLGGGVKLDAPAGLLGSAQLVSAPAAGRSLGAAVQPPVLRDPALPLQPVALAGQRGSDAGLSILELRGDDFSAVTSSTPLRIVTEVVLQADEALLAIAYDGQDYLLVGVPDSADRATLVLPTLPQPLRPEALDETQRSLAGTVWILFQKLVYPRLGRAYSYPLLRSLTLDETGAPVYAPVSAAQVAQAQRIVLLLHGIIGDTRSIGQPLLEAGVLKAYDLVLAYDYESFNTRVPDSARALKERLAQVGLGPGHGKLLHCIAHSMGGLVARWLIEREGGEQIAQQLVMVGTPNQGSPLPKVQDWVFMGIGLALNSLAAGLPALALGALMGGIEQLDVALDELAPNSAMLRDLNSSAAAPVPYTVIAGDAGTLERWQRLGGKLLRQGVGVLFSHEEHDLAVGTTSMTSIRAGQQPQPLVLRVACTHINYFAADEGQAMLSKVVRELCP